MTSGSILLHFGGVFVLLAAQKTSRQAFRDKFRSNSWFYSSDEPFIEGSKDKLSAATPSSFLIESRFGSI